jgi:hypothetical protein
VRNAAAKAVCENPCFFLSVASFFIELVLHSKIPIANAIALCFYDLWFKAMRGDAWRGDAWYGAAKPGMALQGKVF